MYPSLARTVTLSFIALAVAGMLLIESAAASITTIDFTAAAQGGPESKGTSWNPSGADFTVTARWGLNDTDLTGAGTYDASRNPGGGLDEFGDPLTGPTDGLVYQDVDGLGVWANKYKSGKAKKGEPVTYELDPGSDGISGGGPHGKEELIFTFDAPALLDSISVGLIDIKVEGKVPTEWKDDPLFFITGSAGSEIAISEATLFSIFTSTGTDMGYVDFSALSLFSDPSETVDYFRTRNLEDHYEVSFLSYDFPEPTSPVGGDATATPEPGSMLVWMALGAVGVALKRSWFCTDIER